MTTLLEGTTLLDKMRRALARGAEQAARRGEPVLVSVTEPTSAFDAVSLFERAGAVERMLWDQPDEKFSMVAAGAAVGLTGSGSERFAQVADAWRRLIADAVVETNASCPVQAPVCLGGFAFDSHRRAEADWQDFPDAQLTVPRLLCISHEGASWLIASALVTPDCDVPAEAAALAADLDGLLAGSNDGSLGEGTAARTGHQASVSVAEEGDGERWREAVAAIVREIRRGAVEKLVLARRVRLRSSGAIAAGVVLRRLREAYHGCTIFAFAQGESCFLGATPERLVRLEGRSVRADCLAGSAARGDTEEYDRSLGKALLADEKERHEHALVVSSLRETLGPLCDELRVPEQPRLLRMANVQHLHTPVDGAVIDDTGVLELVAALHPTPAAGGWPRQAARSLLPAYEPFDRGWYAGPVGWIDGRGGEFVVAIRSALLAEREALLYAGCGIVDGSEPEREYGESCLKLRPMLWAIDGKSS